MASEADILTEAGNPLLTEAGDTIYIEWSLGVADISFTALQPDLAVQIGVADAGIQGVAVSNVLQQLSIGVAEMSFVGNPPGAGLGISVATVGINGVALNIGLGAGVADMPLSAPAIQNFLIVPDMPDGFEVQRTNDFNDADLSWNSATGANEYVIYRNTNERSQYSQLATTTSTSYTDSSVNQEDLYGYKIASKSSDGILSERTDAVHTSGKETSL